MAFGSNLRFELQMQILATELLKYNLAVKHAAFILINFITFQIFSRFFSL